MTKRKKRKVVFSKIRFLFAFLVFGGITAILGYNLICNINSINEMKLEKKSLQNKIVKLEEEKKELEIDILKLKDPDYIAKYVREKYFYSRDGEVILRMDDK